MPLGQWLGLLFTSKVNTLDHNTGLMAAPAAQPAFNAHYQQHILPQLKEFEAKRLTALRTLRWRFKIALLVGAALVGVASYLLLNTFMASVDPRFLNVANWAMLTTVAGLVLWVYRPVGQYKYSVKTIISPRYSAFLALIIIIAREAPSRFAHWGQMRLSLILKMSIPKTTSRAATATLVLSCWKLNCSKSKALAEAAGRRRCSKGFLSC